MSSTLFGVAPFDITTYAVGAVVIAVVVSAAVGAPLRRILAVNPVVALRVE
jgi:hypothetical protein